MGKALDLGFSGPRFGTPSPKVFFLFLRETPFYFVVSKESSGLAIRLFSSFEAVKTVSTLNSL